MVAEFTTTCAIVTYHHLSCEFEPHSWRGVLNKTLCDKVCQWLAVLLKICHIMTQRCFMLCTTYTNFWSIIFPLEVRCLTPLYTYNVIKQCTEKRNNFIAGSSTCSTKELSIHLTKIMSAVKEGQQKYCETVYSRSGINHMWILKNSKDLYY
jgi:hypothetical protein